MTISTSMHNVRKFNLSRAAASRVREGYRGAVTSQPAATEFLIGDPGAAQKRLMHTIASATGRLPTAKRV